MTRKEQIATVITELDQYRSINKDETIQYAIDANLGFFKSLSSIPKYFIWLFRTAPKLNAKKLLEINDLLPKYDHILHERLILIERKKIPGLINGIVQRITDLVISDSKIQTLGSIGSGGMELERQIIEKLIITNFSRDVTFVGFDRSSDAHKIARKNLSAISSKVSFFSKEILTADDLKEISSQKGIKVIFAKNDIFGLSSEFPASFFDLVYNSLFTHHLSQVEYNLLMNNLRGISKYIVEYDGYRSIPQLIPQSIFGWKDAILLNGSILSGLRYRERNSLPVPDNNTSVKFFPIGTYLLELRQ